MRKDRNGIYERDRSPFWWCSYIDGSGQPTRCSTRVRKDADPRQTEAKRVRARLIAADTKARHLAHSELPQDHHVTTFDELLDAYLAEQEKSLAASTIKRYEYALKHLLPVFTGVRLTAIRRTTVKAYVNQRIAAGAKPATVNNEIALMSGAYLWAQTELEWDILNPWRKLTLQARNARDRYLTRGEAEALIAAAETQHRAKHLSDFIRLGLNTGMRPGEMLALSWDRVDLERNRIYFITRRDQKSGKKESIPLNATARLALLARQRANQARKLVTPWVFCRGNGVRIACVKKSFAQACKTAGIVGLHPHDLRRTFASWLVQEGVSIQTVSGLLRHADIQITHQVYAHLSPDQFKDAAAVLDKPPKLQVVG